MNNSSDRCINCINLSKFVQSFEDQMKISDKARQRVLLRQLYYDPQQSSDFTYEVHTLQRKTPIQIYIL